MRCCQTRLCDFRQSPLDLTDSRNFGDSERCVDICPRCRETVDCVLARSLKWRWPNRPTD